MERESQTPKICTAQRKLQTYHLKGLIKITLKLRHSTIPNQALALPLLVSSPVLFRYSSSISLFQPFTPLCSPTRSSLQQNCLPSRMGGMRQAERLPAPSPGTVNSGHPHRGRHLTPSKKMLQLQTNGVWEYLTAGSTPNLELCGCVAP